MSIAGAVLLIAAGAILRYAVSDSIEGVDLQVIGLILMIAGVVGLVLTFIWLGMARRRGEPADRVRYEERYREAP
jgi:Domain of unknown function (DUF6458)